MDLAQCGKEDTKKFWKNIEKELNSIGPHLKSIFEWQKVWLDKKKYVRKKKSENLKHKTATGGGPFKEYKFTVMEEAIMNMCAMHESVEGCLNAAKFGLPSCNKRREIQTDGSEKENPTSSSYQKNCASHKNSPTPDATELIEILLDSPVKCNQQSRSRSWIQIYQEIVPPRL